MNENEVIDVLEKMGLDKNLPENYRTAAQASIHLFLLLAKRIKALENRKAIEEHEAKKAALMITSQLCANAGKMFMNFALEGDKE